MKLSWQWTVGILLFSVAAVVAGVLLFGGDIGSEIAAAACAVAAWMGLHSPVPGPLKGQPKVATLLATVAAGLALKLYGLLSTVAENPWKLLAAWAVILLCCYVAGKPLTHDFGDVDSDAAQQQQKVG